MGLTSVKKIYLDFYNTNIVTINAKQGDDSSRYVDITCTEYGRKKVLSPSKEIIFVEGKRPDNTNVFVRATITENGTALIDLTEMLVVDGKCVIDLMVVSNEDSKIANVSGAEDLYNLKPSIITTMSFSLNVIPSTISYARLASSDTYTAFADTLKNVAIIETEESARQEAEAERVVAENLRVTNNYIALQACNEATRQANEVAEKLDDVETALINCETVTDNVSVAVANANNAADRANDAAKLMTQIASTRGSSIFYSDVNANEHTFFIAYEHIRMPNDEYIPIVGDVIMTSNGHWHGVVGQSTKGVYIKRLTSYISDGNVPPALKLASVDGYVNTTFISDVDMQTASIKNGDLILCTNGAVFVIVGMDSDGYYVSYLTNLGHTGMSRGTFVYSTLPTYSTGINNKTIGREQLIYNCTISSEYDNPKAGDFIVTYNGLVFLIKSMGHSCNVECLKSLN